MWWPLWRLPDRKQEVQPDEHWIDSATADGSPWSDDMPPEELLARKPTEY